MRQTEVARISIRNNPILKYPADSRRGSDASVVVYRKYSGMFKRARPGLANVKNNTNCDIVSHSLEGKRDAMDALQALNCLENASRLFCSLCYLLAVSPPLLVLLSRYLKLLITHTQSPKE